MWINPNTMQVFLLHSQIRSAFKNISFPRYMSEEHIEQLGIKKVRLTEKPKYDRTKNVIETIPELQNGEWVQVWSVSDATEEEIEQRLNEDIYNSKKIRNDILMSSDWTQLPDAPLTTEQKAAWATYRQALRDLPQQPGFPDIDLPRSPDSVEIGD